MKKVKSGLALAAICTFMCLALTSCDEEQEKEQSTQKVNQPQKPAKQQQGSGSD